MNETDFKSLFLQNSTTGRRRQILTSHTMAWGSSCKVLLKLKYLSSLQTNTCPRRPLEEEEKFISSRQVTTISRNFLLFVNDTTSRTREKGGSLSGGKSAHGVLLANAHDTQHCVRAFAYIYEFVNEKTKHFHASAACKFF